MRQQIAEPRQSPPVHLGRTGQYFGRKLLDCLAHRDELPFNGLPHHWLVKVAVAVFASELHG